TFAVNQNGDVILANTSSVLLFNGQTGAITNLGSWGNAQAVTVDSQNNYYVTNLYGNTIVKVPFVNGAYAAFNNNPAAACTGTDTVACWLPNTTVPANGWYFQVTGIAFDAKGDFFWAAKDSNNNTSNSIWECSAACLYGSGSSAQMIYQEPTTTPAPSASSGTGQLIVGSLAIDPWGNIFFTDSSIFIAADYGIISYFSSVKEIPTSAGAGFGGATTGYAAAPITLYSETIGTPGEYDDELDGVAIDSKGTVYVADQYNGIFAIPNTGGTIPLTGGQPTDMYAVSPQGGKTLAIDGKGNLYVGSYQSGDTLGRITVGSLAAPATATGTQFTVSNISAVVNDGAATPALTFTASSGGQVISNGITATPGTGSALGSAMVFPVTLQASPGQVGLQSAVLTATDTATSDTGWATIYVVGQGPMLTLDPGAWNPYTTGFTAPYSVSVDNNGDLAVADEGAGKVFELVNNTSTWVSIGTGFAAPSATAFDANGNLYIADFTNNNVIEIPNVAGVLAPASQSVLVADTVLFGGTALSKPSGLTVGPDGVLYIADLGNKRVVTFNLASGDTAVRVTGLTNPWGLAVDGANSLYVANTGGGNVLVYSGGGVVTTLTPAGVTKPWGVVVDPSGSVIISDRVTGNIVRVPNEAGTLTDADAVIIEKNPSSGYGLAIDGQGDLFTTDSAGKAVYAIWRNQSSLAFGSINDGSTSAAQTLYAVSAGNTSVTLGTPFVTGLTGPFTEAAGATNGCADGALGPVGHYCELSVTFAPTGTMSGMQSGSFTLNSNATKLPTATVSLSGTAVAPVVLTAQTINFTAPATPVTFGAAAVTLAATGGGSGNAVTFTIDA
ncbi:MAG: NHL repeat-containing protein, partial [Terracidiphilus sp.]